MFQTSFLEARVRLAACVCVIMLSIDFINPVKILSGALQMPSVGSYVAFVAVAFALNLVYANAKDFAYYSTKTFFTSVLNIFFSSIEVLGKENIPKHGPVIFCGNHMNQFVDGGVALVTCPHKISMMVAESSFKKVVIGTFARALGCIPIKRSIDNAKRGPGKIYFDGRRMIGIGTNFKKLNIKDKIRPLGGSSYYRIVEGGIMSDTSAELSNLEGDKNPAKAVCQGIDKAVEYDILGHLDQSETYQKVYEALAKKENLIIFPEGGSHDNTDLLPLNFGIASIALSSIKQTGIDIPIIPIGFNYFRGHKFRGRVVVEYGKPINIGADSELMQLYATDKKAAYADVLETVEDGLRSVIVTAPNYNQLLLVHTARRLYQRSSSGTSTDQKQDMSRRFSFGIRILQDKYRNKMPEDLKKAKEGLEAYAETLKYWGIFDYQVSNLQVPYSKLLYTFLHGLFIMCVASIPTIILNAPAGVAATYWAQRQARIALAKSKVKIEARDVLLTNKIVFCIVGIPVLWVSYSAVLFFYLQWELRTISLAMLCMPIASYIGVRSAEAGMVDIKDLRPAFLRLLPQFREEALILVEKRNTLVKMIRTVVEERGPECGPAYNDPSDYWEYEAGRLVRKNSFDTLPKVGDSVGLEKPQQPPATIDDVPVEVSVRELDTLSPKLTSVEEERVPSGLNEVRTPRTRILGLGKPAVAAKRS